MDSSPRNRLSQRAADIEYSPIRQMFERAAEYEDTDLVHLEIGEPDFDTPEHIVKAATTAASNGETHYTSTAGLEELRRAIASRPGGSVTFDPESEISVTTGGMEALYAALQSVVDPGEEVIVPTPTWPNYFTQIRLAGGSPVELPLPAERGFDLEPSRVTDAITPNTAAIVFSTPSNPTGQAFDADAVREVVAAAAARDCYVIADEVYDSLVYTDHRTGIAGYTDKDDYLLTVNSCSKRYAMTGWRVGWLAGPSDIVAAATKMRGFLTACPPSVSQHAALAALTGPQTPAEEMAETFEQRRDFMIEKIREMPHVSAPEPDGAMYVFLDVSTLPGTSAAIAKRLLDDYRVVTAPGEGFGNAGNGYLRLSFANSLDRIEEGLERIEALVTDELGSDTSSAHD